MKKENWSISRMVLGIPKRRLWFLGGIIATLAVIAALSILFSGSGKTTLNAQSSLKEVLRSAKLSTSEYTYNSIVAVSNEKEVEYYVSYYGTVKAGIDFDRIQVSQQEKKISIVIPDMEITSVDVDTNLDYIFTSEKYDTEQTYAEAYAACCKDLEEKSRSNQTLFQTAKDSAVNTLKALSKPWEEEGYTIDVTFASSQE